MNTVELTEQQLGRLLGRVIEQEYGQQIASMTIKLNSEAVMVPTRLSVIVTFEENVA